MTSSIALREIHFLRRRSTSLNICLRGAFYAEAGPIPTHWELWREVITAYHLYELTPFQKWMGTISSLEDSYIFTPLELAVLSYLEALALDNHKEAKGDIVLLWQSTL